MSSWKVQLCCTRSLLGLLRQGGPKRSKGRRQRFGKRTYWGKHKERWNVKGGRESLLARNQASGECRGWKDWTACCSYLLHRLFTLRPPPFLFPFVPFFSSLLPCINSRSRSFSFFSPRGTARKSRRELQEGWKKGEGKRGSRRRTNALTATDSQFSLYITFILLHFLRNKCLRSFASRLGKYSHNTCLPLPSARADQRPTPRYSVPLCLCFSRSTISFPVLEEGTRNKVIKGRPGGRWVNRDDTPLAPFYLVTLVPFVAFAGGSKYHESLLGYKATFSDGLGDRVTICCLTKVSIWCWKVNIGACGM